MEKNVEQHLFQSGEIVTVSGTFNVVGIHPARQYYLEAGTRFPNYDGRSVCWHLDHCGPPRTDLSIEKPYEKGHMASDQ